MKRRLFDRVEEIAFQGVWKRYGKTTALGPLDFSIRGGELLAVVGRSGCGKTTMLRMINRLIDPDEGKILLNGRDTRDFDPIDLRRNTGYVIQQIGLFPHMTVEENIGLVLSLQGLSRDEVEDQVASLLEMVRLVPDLFMHRFPRDLSGGQQQRVGLARALATDPPLLLMDEPFGALDPILRGQLQEEFLRIRKGLEKTIVFVTHDLDEAFLLGDRIAVMHDGQVVRAGTPDELLLDSGRGPADEILGNRTLRHLDRLKLRSFLIPLDAFASLQAATRAGEGLDILQREGTYAAVIFDGDIPTGVVTVRDLLPPGRRDMPLGGIVPRTPLLSVEDGLPASMAALRTAGRSYALAEEKGTITGVFSLEDAIYRVIG